MTHCTSSRPEDSVSEHATSHTTFSRICSELLLCTLFKSFKMLIITTPRRRIDRQNSFTRDNARVWGEIGRPLFFFFCHVQYFRATEFLITKGSFVDYGAQLLMAMGVPKMSIQSDNKFTALNLYKSAG